VVSDDRALRRLARDIESWSAGHSIRSVHRWVSVPERTHGDLMRRLELCEEKGSDVDKVIRAVEDVPPSAIRKLERFFKADDDWKTVESRLRALDLNKLGLLPYALHKLQRAISPKA
jgi:hypothetical protein